MLRRINHAIDMQRSVIKEASCVLFPTDNLPLRLEMHGGIICADPKC